MALGPLLSQLALEEISTKSVHGNCEERLRRSNLDRSSAQQPGEFFSRPPGYAFTAATSLAPPLEDRRPHRRRVIDGNRGKWVDTLHQRKCANWYSINLGDVEEMSQKIALRSAAILGAALLTTSLSLAQQPPTPPAANALEALASSAGDLGVDTKTYSAIVGSSGVLHLGPAGSSATHLSTGTYQVTFPSDVSKCVYTATIGTSPASFLAPAIVTVTPRSGNANAVFVQTFSLTGAAANHPFNIHVQC